MSIKCSLLGHRFGDTTVEREREEDGSEVVITITEQETCTRCGETRVVSENKEVTTMETPDDAGTVDSSAPDPNATASEASETDDADVPEDGDDAVILGDDADETDAQAEARGSPASIPDAEADASPGDGEEGDVDADEDDAVILGDDTQTEPGDEPAEPADEQATVDASGSDASDEAGTADVDADDADETEPGAEYQQGESSGEWPEETKPADAVAGEDAMDDWPEETKRDIGGEASGAGPDLEESASPTITVPEGMFKCSECGFETEVELSSLRAGDFCPECHQGTLMQHEDSDE